uniref:ANK_REP_REGION domain-containing protein n=1 Tax=Macrostomum lignano TaxID=282301 RepID=A0A1I8IUD1_9PLAT
MKRQRESCHLRKLAKYTRTFAELGCSLEAKDVHGNTPVHLILYHCLQTGKSPVIADRLLSDLLGCQRPGRRAELLRLCNSAGVSCQRLLDRLADQEAATSAAADAALTADIDERDADNSETIIWQLPWPPFLIDSAVGPEAALRWLRLAVGGDAEGLVAELRQLRVLWHPDKFMQKFGDRLPAGRPVREAVLRRVTLASQLANGAAALLAGILSGSRLL